MNDISNFQLVLLKTGISLIQSNMIQKCIYISLYDEEMFHSDKIFPIQICKLIYEYAPQKLGLGWYPIGLRPYSTILLHVFFTFIVYFDNLQIGTH